MSSGWPEAAPAMPPPAIEEVSNGIFAYIQLDGSWFLNNAGCLVGSRTATLIDTTGTEARAQAWRAAVRSITDRPVATVVNSHHHADHTNGNFAFETAAIVAHDLCRSEVVASGGFPRTSPVFPGTDFGDCPVTPPTVTFRERLDLFVDDLTVHLMFVGPAHTTNDIIAWIPGRKLLFSGDLIFNGGTPFALFGSIGGWLEALDRLEALGAETIVPGHGAVAGPAVIGEVRAYLQFIAQTAAAGFAAGVPPLELAASTDLGPFASLCDSERLVGNLHRAYSELRGEPRGTPLPIFPMFEEMKRFNGGRPLRCFA